MSHPPGLMSLRSRAAAIALAVFVAAVGVFLLASDSVTERGITVHVDRQLVDLVVAHRVAGLTDLSRAWTLLGSAWIVAPVVTVGVIGLVSRRRFVSAAIIAASPAVTAVIVSIVKAAVDRPRPPALDQLVAAVGKAFPSGHSAQSVACYAALAWVVTRETGRFRLRIGVWSAAAVIALGVGWSRVYLGVHWPSDVVGGWSLAAAVLSALVFVDLVFAGRSVPVRSTRSP